MNMNAVILVATWVGLTLAPSLAAAEVEPTAEIPSGHYRPNQSPYAVNLALELPLLLIGATVLNGPRFFINETGGPACGLSCDPSGINALDREFAGRGSQTYGDISDYTMFSLIPTPFLFDLIDVAASKPHDGWRGYGIDTFVLIETMVVTLSVNSMVAVVAHRPRPYVYRDSTPDDFRQRGEASLSFYSGHVSVAFAGATAYSRLFQLRHPDSALIVPMWIFTHAMASWLGVVRVLSGSHFPTDVIVGAASGVGFGLLIPWLHELPRVGAVASLRPYFAGGSAGLMGVF
jgi:membrane-associated phospholipid phosphatase